MARDGMIKKSNDVKMTFDRQIVTEEVWNFEMRHEMIWN
jgi:hypothetical protein